MGPDQQAVNFNFLYTGLGNVSVWACCGSARSCPLSCPPILFLAPIKTGDSFLLFSQAEAVAWLVLRLVSINWWEVFVVLLWFCARSGPMLWPDTRTCSVCHSLKGLVLVCHLQPKASSFLGRAHRLSPYMGQADP